MRKEFFMLLIKKYLMIIFLFILFFSCNKNTENFSLYSNKITNKTLNTFINPYLNLGDFHNRGLDSVYLYLNNNRDSIINYNSLLQITSHGIKKYIENSGNDYCKESIKKGYTVAKQYYNFYKDSTQISPYDSLLKTDDFNFKQLYYFKHMFNLYKYSLSTSDMYDSLNVLNYEIYSNLDSTESKPLLIISAILGRSYDYWNNANNYNKWESLSMSINNNLLKISSNESTLGDIGKADAVSAGAAVIPCIGSTVGYIGCVGGAAVGGSAVYALITWIF